MKKLIAVLGLLFVLSIALPGYAAQGFYLGTGLGLAVPSQGGDVLNEVNPETGFAWEIVHLGFNFTDNLGIGMQLGTVGGPTDWEPDHDLIWGEDYLTFSGRYTFTGSDFEPYVEAGPGIYTYSLIADRWDGLSDTALGARVALGGNFNMGHLYLTPELSYHFVNFDHMDVNDDDFGDYTVDFHSRGDMLLLLLKIGYQFGH